MTRAAEVDRRMLARSVSKHPTVAGDLVIRPGFFGQLEMRLYDIFYVGQRDPSRIAT